MNTNVKDYLSQTWRINNLIDAKIEQVAALHELATKATSTLTDEPRSGTRDIHRMEDAIAKMLDIETEINVAIRQLVNLKSDIAKAINALSDPSHRVVLELRYLCFKPWEEIASAMHYALRNVHYIHGKALLAIADNIEDCTIIC